MKKHIFLPDATAGEFRARQAVLAEMRKWAVICHANGFPIDWRGYGEAIGNQLLWTAPGLYLSEYWKSQNARYERGSAARNWLAPTASAALCAYKNHLCKNLAELPTTLVEAVEEGIARAKRCGHRKMTKNQLAALIGLSSADRLEWRLFRLGASDLLDVDLDAQRKARKAAYERTQRAKRNAARRIVRNKAARAAGKMTKDEYLAKAQLVRIACDAEGISRRTFYRRSPQARAALLAHASTLRLALSLAANGTSDGTFNQLRSRELQATTCATERTMQKADAAPPTRRARAGAPQTKITLQQPCSGEVQGLGDGLERALSRLKTNVEGSARAGGR